MAEGGPAELSRVADFNVEGVVLRRWDSGESDRRVALLTRERGKLYVVMRGARKANARLAGVSEPGVHAKFALATGKRNAYVTQAQPISSHAHLRDDFRRISAAFAFLESVDALLQLDEPANDAFDLCVVALDAIASVKEPLGALAWADLKLLEATGFAPELNASVISGATLRGERITLSAEAGGALNRAESQGLRHHHDVSKEVLITLQKLQPLREPPDFIKLAYDVSKALIPFFLEFTGSELPARRALLDSAKA